MPNDLVTFEQRKDGLSTDFAYNHKLYKYKFVSSFVYTILAKKCDYWLEGIGGAS